MILNEYTESVRETINMRREEAEREAERRARALYAEHPKLKELDKKMSETGPRIFMAITKGKDASGKTLSEIRSENLRWQQERLNYLNEIGVDAEYLDPPYTCKICSDKGYIHNKMCECFKKGIIEAGILASGMGNLIQKQSFENFFLDYYQEGVEYQMAKATFDYCQEYANHFKPTSGNILLMGGTGLGKTHLTTSIAKVVIEKGYTVRYDSAQNIFHAFEYDHFKARADEESHSERYETTNLLIIDDLGTEMATPFNLSCLYNLINTRINHAYPTIISTNLSEKELSARYDDRITSRLFGEYRVLLLSGKDIRQQKL